MRGESEKSEGKRRDGHENERGKVRIKSHVQDTEMRACSFDTCWK